MEYDLLSIKTDNLKFALLMDEFNTKNSPQGIPFMLQKTAINGRPGNDEITGLKASTYLSVLHIYLGRLQ